MDDGFLYNGLWFASADSIPESSQDGVEGGTFFYYLFCMYN